jgi:ABC-2 type transport system ATP-binding protein
MTPAVRGRGITKYFGDVIALDGVDLDVAAGQVHGLVGPNGAGKTTLLGILLGLATADGGTLEVLGQPAGHSLLVPDGVAGFVDGPGVYPSLTARRNLAELARLRGRGGDGAKAEIDDALAQVGLTDVADDKVRGFSLGMRQRVGLAAALLIRPRLLILDEPSNGLDPVGQLEMHRLIRDLAASGRTILLSSHDLREVEELCGRVGVIGGGRLLIEGTPAELRGQDRRPLRDVFIELTGGRTGGADSLRQPAPGGPQPDRTGESR